MSFTQAQFFPGLEIIEVRKNRTFITIICCNFYNSSTIYLPSSLNFSTSVYPSLCFGNNMPFCFQLRFGKFLFSPKMYCDIKLGSGPRLLFVTKFSTRRDRTRNNSVKTKQKKSLSFLMDLRFGAMWNVGFYQLHLS